ncbi:MAG: TlpA family protein disulfide reductase [Gemmatimonadaceae bacterium]|nr:TlpA family protein disulfide reductase [Gemmatimonadaceae bacterium]
MNSGPIDRARIGRWLGNLFWLALLVWAAPRCWPHVEAVIGRSASDARQPVFTVQTRDGRVLTADSLRGRVVLVNIWATWCPPCRAEMPALQQLADSHADEPFVLLGLSVDRGPASSVDRFLRERGISYPNAIITDDILRAFGGVRGYPTSFLLDKRGVLRHTVLGPVAPLTLRPAIARLLREDDAPTRAAAPLRSR